MSKFPTFQALHSLKYSTESEQNKEIHKITEFPQKFCTFSNFSRFVSQVLAVAPHLPAARCPRPSLGPGPWSSNCVDLSWQFTQFCYRLQHFTMVFPTFFANVAQGFTWFSQWFLPYFIIFEDVLPKVLPWFTQSTISSSISFQNHTFRELIVLDRIWNSRKNIT